MSIGFKDLENKANIIKQNRETMTKKYGFVAAGSTEYIHLMEFMKVEEAFGLQGLNSVNMDK